MLKVRHLHVLSDEALAEKYKKVKVKTVKRSCALDTDIL